MGPLQYYAGLWDRAALTIVGFFTIVMALVSGALVLVRRNALAEREQALAGGLAIGLVVGLAGGIGFLSLESQTGGGIFFLAPLDIQTGLLCGLELGALAALAIGAFIAQRSIALAGTLIDMLLGLAIFRLLFGPSAGLGGEVGLGVGRDVGIMFGTAGGLLGGIAGQAISVARQKRAIRGLPPDTPPDTLAPASPGWRWPVIGMAFGALAAALIGALGAWLGIFEFLVPYNAQIPDVPPDTSPAGMLHNLLFGLGLFAVGGALIGCFLGLQWMASAEDGARHHRLWLGVGLIVALICGLSFGFGHRYVGGPLLVTPQLPPDPIAAVRGLLIGLAGGAVAGFLLLMLTRTNHARWQTLTGTAMALLIGLLAVALPYWFTPFFAISIR
ncbi:MAG TPA: hypothetical protein VF040_08895 [Ktedonobacterales bacterium]